MVTSRHLDYTKKISFVGIISITLLGVILHYVYDWTNKTLLFTPFVPVNESVWEHLKLGFYGLILFSIFEYKYVIKRVNNYFLAKLLGVLLLEMTIVIIFYTYNFFSKGSILWVDISSYVLGVIGCQYLTQYIYLKKEISKKLNLAALIFLFSFVILFSLFTYYPPKFPIFKDNNNNTFGINKA